MINFQPSEEQDLLRQTLSGFAREVVRPAAREADEKEVVPTPVVAKSWELGLVQDAIPEAMGGFGSPRSAIAGTFILEELAYGSLGIALHLVTPRLFTVPLIVAGTDAQRAGMATALRRRQVHGRPRPPSRSPAGASIRPPSPPPPKRRAATGCSAGRSALSRSRPRPT
jgi:alkylation response protein AidB-like acyl-CoA dehydrogenase